MNTGNNFTIEDIHNIRYANYEKTKNLSPKELIEKTKKEATSGWTRLDKLKQKQKQKTD